jgi:hypothetical protein
MTEERCAFCNERERRQIIRRQSISRQIHSLSDLVRARAAMHQKMHCKIFVQQTLQKHFIQSIVGPT